MINKHIALLGMKVEDKVTEFKGIVTLMSFDLYGCIQAVVTPPITKNQTKEDGQWFDISRIKILSKKRVMDIPNFESGAIAEGEKGAAMKPPGRINM